MSRTRGDRKPQRATSPARLRSRQGHPYAAIAAHTPLGSSSQTEIPDRSWMMYEYGLRREYNSISCELSALAKAVHGEFGNPGDLDPVGLIGDLAGAPTCLFERGKYYEDYAARRNERLRKRKCEAENERTAGLSVISEPTKRRGESKKSVQGGRRPLTEGFTGGQTDTSTPRYSLRSSRKENKKPPVAAVGAAPEYSGARKSRAGRGRKI